MQKYDPGKKYNFLNMVPPWSNFRIDADDEIRSPELLTAYLKQSASFPQTFDTFHDYDGLMDALQKTEKGEGIKITVSADDTIAQGSCILIANNGVIDANFKTQLAVLQNAFGIYKGGM